MSKLIINCDDFGMSEGINRVVELGFKKHFISSTTMMVNKDFVEDAMELYFKNNIHVGIHFTMTTGKSLGKHQLITDENGHFHQQSYYVERGFHLTDEMYQEMKEEWILQIERGKELGIHITHLDGHHHMYMHEAKGRELAYEIARKYNLPLRVDPRYFNEDEIPEDIKHPAHFIYTIDSIAHQCYQNEAKMKELLEPVMKEISEYETTEIMCHPAFIDEYLMSHTSMNLQRMETLYLLHSPIFQELLEKYHIELISYKDL